MRQHLRNILSNDRRSGDRIAATCNDADADHQRLNLGAEIIRIARTATSIHLAAPHQGERREDSEDFVDRSVREPST